MQIPCNGMFVNIPCSGGCFWGFTGNQLLLYLC